MTTPTMMYWLITLDNIQIAAALMGGVSAIGFLFALVGALEEAIKWKYPISLGIASLVMILVLIFVPSTKQMAAILIVPKIANSEKVQTVGNELYNLAVEWMEELRPAKAKGENNGSK